MTEPTISDEDSEKKSLMYIFRKKHDNWSKRMHLYIKNKKRLYALLYGQCTPSLISSIKSTPNFTTFDDARDIMWLLKTVKLLSVGIDENNNELVSAHDAVRRFFHMYQKPLETNDDYLERFKEYWATASAAAGNNCLVPNIVRTSVKYLKLTQDEWIEAVKALYFSCILIEFGLVRR